MRIRRALFFAVATALAAAWSPRLPTAVAEDQVAPRIAWYGTLASGLAEAKRSNRPILFISAAPQCLGVSGIW